MMEFPLAKFAKRIKTMIKSCKSDVSSPVMFLSLLGQRRRSYDSNEELESAAV